ncbi:MAG: DUF5074 domain-containing protein [Tannerellaceae bacterium]|nr:DUF5074 domain-containing protein [Tannerellaceae bacterium]
MVGNSNYATSITSVQFTSCTFNYRFTGRTLIHHTHTSHHTSIDITFTNTLLIHPGATIDRPSIKHTAGYEGQFKSQGYNIIIGQIHGTTPESEIVPWKHATDQYLPVNHDHSQIVTIGEDGHHKVVVGEGGAGLAYRNLLANPTVLILNENFPEKDILGNDIDYTKPTHTGAYQAIDGTDIPLEVLPTGITLSDSKTTNLTVAEMFTETTLQVYAQVQPVGATQEVTWSATPAGVVNISETGLITAPATSLTTNRTVTVTATANARGAGDAVISGSLTLTVKPYIHVATVSLPDTVYVTYGYKNGVRAKVSPANVNNPKLSWHIPTGKPVLATFPSTGDTITFTTILNQLGVTQVVAKAEDGERTDTVILVVRRPDYTQGVFILNEDWFGHTFSSINHLYPDGHWDYRAYMAANPSGDPSFNWTLGTTAQFGCIYGNKIFITRKQPGKYHVTRADARTLEKDPVNTAWTAASAALGASDGRANLPLSETKVYESTSNGILCIDYENYTITNVGGVNGSSTSVYSDQVGTMRRVGDRVFAVHQTDGILVIDLNIHAVVQTLAPHAHPSTLTQSLDGYLWAGTTLSTNSGNLEDEASNVLLRIDPWTLEVKEVPLPVGVNSPITSFGAWQFDPVWASTKENKLYWTLGSGWAGGGIYEYDINRGTGKAAFLLGNYTNELGGDWHFYSTGFGIHPSSGEVYACIYKGIIGDPTWCTIKFHPDSTAKDLTDYRHVTTYYMNGYKYWYPAMPIFPDTAPPRAVAGKALPASIDIPCNRSGDTLRLGDKVTDADNLDAAMVLSVSEGYDKSLIYPTIWRDSLIIQRRKTVVAGAAPVSTSLTVAFNSNGRTFTHTMTVSISADPNAPVLGALTLTPGKDTLKIGVKPTVMLTPTAGYPALNWNSSNTAVAVVQPSGQVVAVATGQTTITATHPDDATRTATAVITVIDPNQLPVIEPPVIDIEALPALTLTPDKDSLKLGVKPTVVLVPTAGYPALIWSSSDESVAMVQPNGQVIALLPGQTTITATVEGSTDPLRTATALITVIDPNQPPVIEPPVIDIEALPALTLTPDKDSLKLGVKPTVVLVPTAGYPALIWSSSDEGVAMVQPNGQVIALLPGQTTITATVEGSTDPLRTATAVITVTANEVSDGVTAMPAGELTAGYTAVYYTLTGQRLGDSLPVRPGLYIVRMHHPTLPPIVQKIFLSK